MKTADESRIETFETKRIRQIFRMS